jgi:hypothetical protein
VLRASVPKVWSVSAHDKNKGSEHARQLIRESTACLILGTYSLTAENGAPSEMLDAQMHRLHRYLAPARYTHTVLRNSIWSRD